MRSLAKRDVSKVEQSRKVVEYVRKQLDQGRALQPAELEKLKS